MAQTFRPKLNVKLIIEDKLYEFSTNLRDSLRLTKPSDNQNENITRLAWYACERLEIFKGSFDEFIDAVDANLIITDDDSPLVVTGQQES